MSSGTNCSKVAHIVCVGNLFHTNNLERVC